MWGRAERALLRLDIGRPDHLAPLLGFVGDELAEVGGRAGDYRAAQVGKPRFHRRVGEPRIDLLVQPVDDLHGRFVGRTEAKPPGRLVTWYEFAHRRNVG